MRCCSAQYLVIIFSSFVLRDNRCVYKAHVCLYIRCSDGALFSGNVCSILLIVKDCGFLSRDGCVGYVVHVCRG